MGSYKARWFQDGCSDARQCTQDPLRPYFSILFSRVAVGCDAPTISVAVWAAALQRSIYKRAPRGHALAGFRYHTQILRWNRENTCSAERSLA